MTKTRADISSLGAAYLQQSDNENALREFQAAYSLSKRPELLLNIANVYERMGKPKDAVEALTKYLASRPQGVRSDDTRDTHRQPEEASGGRETQHTAARSELERSSGAEPLRLWHLHHRLRPHRDTEARALAQSHAGVRSTRRWRRNRNRCGHHRLHRQRQIRQGRSRQLGLQADVPR